MMQGLLAIWTREFRAYFISPIFYAISTVFIIIISVMFFQSLEYYQQIFMQAAQYPPLMERININEMIMRPMFNTMSFVAVLILMPMLTMRVFSEEKKTGTIELILTSPVRDWHVILGKFMAAFSLYAAMMGLTLIYPLVLQIYGDPDWGPIWTGYAGLLLMGASVITIGLFVSSLTENQIVSGVVCFGVALILWMLDFATDTIEGPLGEAIAYLSVTRHFDTFEKGVVDTTDLLFFVSFIFFGLFITVRSLESTRWRQ
ncbi:MAG: ABC transporter permease subunit [candidate division Zixibacteria bacterium]|nr:ABC transporter permease subunit [candidate division Zixibacteria bacterium]